MPSDQASWVCSVCAPNGQTKFGHGQIWDSAKIRVKWFHKKNQGKWFHLKKNSGLNDCMLVAKPKLEPWQNEAYGVTWHFVFFTGPNVVLAGLRADKSGYSHYKPRIVYLVTKNALVELLVYKFDTILNRYC
jgi:CDP-glycerol glycerophosphotransferase (TagB/SpsB family)